MNVNELYELWLAKADRDPDLREELLSVRGKEDEINDRFWKTLAFGTGGLRGVIGAGTNRMNVYTVSQATQGLADYLNAKFDAPSVAIAHDSRIKSDVFARAAASVLAANGVKVHMYSRLAPTPMLSYAVRKLGCSSGIVVTASHNPSKYNGYKCYNVNGYQMTDDEATELYNIIQTVDMFDGVKTTDFDAAVEGGMIDCACDGLFEDFYADELACRIEPEVAEKAGLKILYTPLNGTGNVPIREILRRCGHKDLRVIASQEQPDGTFPTCPFPNPEIKQVFEEGFKLTADFPADLIIASDPDADRIGIAVKHDGEYHLMSGNEVGCMLTDYILSRRKARGTLPATPVVVKTIVTTELVTAIAASYGAETVSLLTGFKYIGEFITEKEKIGRKDDFLLGFEESYGYLAGTFVREKDAVNAAVLIAEMTAYRKSVGDDLYAYMQSLYKKFGMYQNSLLNFQFEGEDGMKKMAAIMAALRARTPKEIAGLKVLRVGDCKTQTVTDLASGKSESTGLPVSDVILLFLENDCKVVVRPSGTEPKLKAYLTANAPDADGAEKLTAAIAADVKKILGIEE
ncbi:MAG: phospho-sugar mutase [Clostridia bacterium]|nr:phospho-sugar mutase [Clostridia bacterium]